MLALMICKIIVGVTFQEQFALKIRSNASCKISLLWEHNLPKKGTCSQKPLFPKSEKSPVFLLTIPIRNLNRIECFHMTSQRPYWCTKTMKRRPCWCPKLVPWELNSFLMQTISFVTINLHICWPRE